jgi:hypothetical protein
MRWKQIEDEPKVFLSKSNGLLPRSWMYVFAIWSSMNAKSFRSLCRIGANSRIAIAIFFRSGRSMGNEV